MEKSIAFKKAFEFAKLIVSQYKTMINEKKEYIMSKQLLRSGTSIGANLAEANGAISNAVFSAKVSIAYKESLETKYWLMLLHDSDFISENDYNGLYQKADEIAKILFSILKSTGRVKK